MPIFFKWLWPYVKISDMQDGPYTCLAFAPMVSGSSSLLLLASSSSSSCSKSSGCSCSAACLCNRCASSSSSLRASSSSVNCSRAQVCVRACCCWSKGGQGLWCMHLQQSVILDSHCNLACAAATPAETDTAVASSLLHVMHHHAGSSGTCCAE